MNDPFARLNDAFRPAYDRVRAGRLAAHRPILFAAGDQLVLYRDDGRHEARLEIPRQVDDLKAVAHLVLTAFLLVGLDDRPLADEERADASSLLERVTAAEAALADRGLSAPQVVRQRALLHRSRGLLTDALAGGRTSGARGAAFVDACRPEVDANTADAARLMLEVLHRGVGRLWTTLRRDERDRLIVVNAGTKSAREGAQLARYCAWMMGVAGEGERLVFAEGARDEDEALAVLATFLADTEIGLAFGGHPLAFMRDVLGAPTDELLAGATFATLPDVLAAAGKDGRPEAQTGAGQTRGQMRGSA